MPSKIKSLIIVLVVFVVLGMIGSIFGFNKIKEERTAHELTKKALVEEKKKEKIRTITRTIRVPVDIGGRIVFREETVIDNSRETDVSRRSETDERDRNETESSQRPAVKKWQIMAAQQVYGGSGQMYGAGYRQSLWIIEVAVWGLGSPTAGLVGATIAF